MKISDCGLRIAELNDLSARCHSEDWAALRPLRHGDWEQINYLHIITYLV